MFQPSTSPSSRLPFEDNPGRVQKSPRRPPGPGLAINALTRNPLPPDDTTVNASGQETGPLATNKVVFKQNFAAFLSLLSEVTNSLTEEADALVEANLLPEKAPKKGAEVEDGLGGLDVGYLNSRTRDVGLVKERELVGEMRGLLERYVERMEKEGKDGDGDDKMDET